MPVDITPLLEGINPSLELKKCLIILTPLTIGCNEHADYAKGCPHCAHSALFSAIHVFFQLMKRGAWKYMSEHYIRDQVKAKIEQVTGQFFPYITYLDYHVRTLCPGCIRHIEKYAIV